MKTHVQTAPTFRGQASILILIYVLMATGIVFTGYIYYLNYKQKYRANVERQLSSIANLKVGELALWRQERLGDGALLFKNSAFSALVRRFLEKPGDVEAQGRLSEWIGKYHTVNQNARVSLFDTHGIQRMSVPQTSDPDDLFVAHNGAEIMRDGLVFFQDFHREAGAGPIHLAIVVPIFDEADARRPLGVLVMDIDPAIYLYPFIIRWPTPSQTAETFLVRRDGDDILFLNELKFDKNAALNRRIPLTRRDLPAVKAALGQKGVVEGVDYRGENVIAAVGAVPDSPWYLVARMDTAEVYAPLRERMWLIVMLVGILLLGSGMGMGLIWRQWNVRFYKECYESAEALRKAEESLRESDISLRESQAIAGLGSYVLDVPTGLWKGSDVLDEVFGIGEAYERTVEGWAAVLHPDDRAIMVSYLRNEVIDRGQPFDKEYRIIRHDNKAERWVHGLGRLEFDALGRPLKMRGTIQDITGRKQAEIELRQAKEQAEAATKLKDKFVEMVAHDLRSPLSSMMGLLKHFAERNPCFSDEECKKIFDLVLKSGYRMIDMTQELLKLSRLQTGKITPQPRFFKGYIAATSAIESLSHNAAQKGIKIINEVPVNTRLYADQSLFDEVLLNLLSNAIKFCSDGDRITIFTPPGLKSAIAVRDTGKGINETCISSLFRHEATTSTPGTAGEIGTGLGLPYCHDIMRAHGGELTVESTPGEGSVFCASLPYVKPVGLIVEDDPIILMVVREYLEKVDIDVIEVLNGAQALAVLKDKRPDIIITDINMPEMDGFTLMDRLKQDSATRDIPVIAMTTNDMGMREKVFMHGANDFVSKPFTMEDLIPRVRRMLG